MSNLDKHPGYKDTFLHNQNQNQTKRNKKETWMPIYWGIVYTVSPLTPSITRLTEPCHAPLLSILEYEPKMKSIIVENITSSINNMEIKYICLDV